MPVATEKNDLTSELLQDAAAAEPEPFSQACMETECVKEPPPLLNKPQMETAIVFDWDDTLLASTVLALKGYRLDGGFVRCPELEAELRQLERVVCSLLSNASRYGKVHIVTNAEHGWVQLSAQKFMPGVLPYLGMATIVSARSTFEGRYPGLPLQWKVCAMRERLSNSFENSESLKNVLSFGDSHVEREAIKIASSGLQNARTKSIKFAERPTVEQLRRQLELVMSCFQNLFAYEGDLDLMLQITPEPAAPISAAPTQGALETQVQVQA